MCSIKKKNIFKIREHVDSDLEGYWPTNQNLLFPLSKDRLI